MPRADCASALTDDLPDLLEDAELGKRVAKSVKMIDAFLADELESGRLEHRFTTKCKRVLLHGHCHQKSLYGTESMRRVLDTIEGLKVRKRWMLAAAAWPGRLAMRSTTCP